MKKDKRKAPPVTTGYDPRAVERAPEFADGHLPPDDHIPRSTVGADDSVRPSPPTAPDGISGDWQ